MTSYIRLQGIINHFIPKYNQGPDDTISSHCRRVWKFLKCMEKNDIKGAQAICKQLKEISLTSVDIATLQKELSSFVDSEPDRLERRVRAKDCYLQVCKMLGKDSLSGDIPYEDILEILGCFINFTQYKRSYFFGDYNTLTSNEFTTILSSLLRKNSSKSLELFEKIIQESPYALEEDVPISKLIYAQKGLSIETRKKAAQILFAVAGISINNFTYFLEKEETQVVKEIAASLPKNFFSTQGADSISNLFSVINNAKKASPEKKIEVMKALLRGGCQPTTKALDGSTYNLLHDFIKVGNGEMILSILPLLSAEVLNTKQEGVTPLEMLCSSSLFSSERKGKIVVALLQGGASAVGTTSTGHSTNILYDLISWGEGEVILSILPLLSDKILDTKHQGITPLQSMCHPYSLSKFSLEMKKKIIIALVQRRGTTVIGSGEGYRYNILHDLIMAGEGEVILSILPLISSVVRHNVESDGVNLFQEICLRHNDDKFNMEIKEKIILALLEERIDPRSSSYQPLLTFLVNQGETTFLLRILPHLPTDFLNWYQKSVRDLPLCVVGESTLPEKEKIQIVQALIEKGADPLVLDEVNKKTILHYIFEQEAVSRYLLCSLPKESKDRLLHLTFAGNPFYIAYFDYTHTHEERIQRVLELIRGGRDPVKEIWGSKSILHVMTWLGDVKALEEIFTIVPKSAIKAFLEKSDNKNRKILQLGYTNQAISWEKRIQVIKMFLELGANPLLLDDKGRSIVSDLLQRKEVQIFTWLMSTLPKDVVLKMVNLPDANRFPPLIALCKAERRDLKGEIALLVHYGADPLQPDGKGNTIVHFLIEQRDMDTLLFVLSLLQSEKDKIKKLVNLKSSAGEIPLHTLLDPGLSYPDHTKRLLVLFIEAEVEIGHKDPLGKTILTKCIELDQYGAFGEYSVLLLTTLSKEKKQELLELTAGPSLLLQTWYDTSDSHRTTKLLKLCKTGTNIAEMDSIGENILYKLVKEQNTQAIALLIKNTPSKELERVVAQENSFGQSLFLKICMLSDNQLVQDFLSIVNVKNIPLVSMNELMLFLVRKGDLFSIKVVKNKLSFSSLTLSEIQKCLQENKASLVEEFCKFIDNKLPVYGADPTTDMQTADLLTVFMKYNKELSPILYDIGMNDKLCLYPYELEKIVNIYEKYKNTKHDSSVRIAIQTCTDITILECALGALGLDPIYEPIAFLALPEERQKALLSSYVVFRDRRGLALASTIIERASRGPSLASKELTTLSLELVSKTQILSDPQRDETALLTLICSLLAHADATASQEISAILATSIRSLANLDRVRLKNQYKAGTFEAFRLAKKLGNTPLLLSCVYALGAYPYEGGNEEDQIVIGSLIKLAKDPEISIELKRGLADVLASIRNEKALLTAWEIIRGPTWDHYSVWHDAQEKFYQGTFDLFKTRPFAIHDNPGNMRKKILDGLGRCNYAGFQGKVHQVYEEFLKTPEKYPGLQRFDTRLKSLPGGFENSDPLYLPPHSIIFRGIGSRKGEARAYDALLDLFERGIGDSELSRASFGQGTFAKAGHFFCAMDYGYSSGYVDNHGALIVIDGEYINECIEKRRARQQKQGDSFHYILYDTVSHKHIKSIYVHTDILKELEKLRKADPENVSDLKLKYFGYLSGEECKRLIRFLHHDPHKIFEKLRAHDVQQGPHQVFEKQRAHNNLTNLKPTERQTSIPELFEENIKREILRNFMAQKYGEHFKVAIARL